MCAHGAEPCAGVPCVIYVYVLICYDTFIYIYVLLSGGTIPVHRSSGCCSSGWAARSVRAPIRPTAPFSCTAGTPARCD
jgi:hypothetical protein